MRRGSMLEILMNGFPYPWKHQFLQGILLILFGLIVAVYPQLLVMLISSVFILIGVIMISSALAVSRAYKNHHYARAEYYELF